MKIAFPYAGEFEVLHWSYQSQEVAGVVSVGACRVCLSVHRPLLHKGLQKAPH